MNKNYIFFKINLNIDINNQPNFSIQYNNTWNQMNLLNKTKRKKH